MVMLPERTYFSPVSRISALIASDWSPMSAAYGTFLDCIA